MNARDGVCSVSSWHARDSGHASEVALYCEGIRVAAHPCRFGSVNATGWVAGHVRKDKLT